MRNQSCSRVKACQ